MADEVDRVAMVSDLVALETRLETKLESKIDTTISDVMSVVSQEAERTRCHFDIVAEQMRGEFKVVADRTMATNANVDRLIAQNAIEHAAFVEAIADHEVRQRVLEKMHERPAQPDA